ncbi:MAG: galactokinase [Polyangiaceae bacterium]
MIDPRKLRAQFEHQHGQAGRLFSAPGRVNLIGEHTDYNDGFVLPMAIDRRTYVVGCARPDRRVFVHSLTTGGSFSFDLDQPGPKRRGSWLDYVEGTAQALLTRGFKLGGANLLIDSDVPSGAGLSASAALELAVGYALVRLNGTVQPDRVQLALAGQAAEHDYVGTQCGIMDQYIVALGQESRALLIDCRSLVAEPVRFELGSACVLVCDTRVKHELSSSAYNERRRECQEGVALLAQHRPEVHALRDLSLSAFEALAPELPTRIAQRCRHVISENERTLTAARCLAEGLLSEFGALMYASHESLRASYEVSCPELDLCVSVAASQPEVYGARMTGGGFGGCTVTLLEKTAVEPVMNAIRRSFAERFGGTPEFFTSHAAPGMRED